MSHAKPPPVIRQTLLVVRPPALEEEHVAPDAVEAAEPLADADDPEAAPLVQRDARRVLREDAGLDRPDPGLVGAAAEPREERAPDPSPARGLRDVDAVLGDTGVTAALGDRRERGPADDLSGLLRDETVPGEMAGVPVLPGRSIGLERRVARGDPLLVDRPHGRPVARVEGPDQQSK